MTDPMYASFVIRQRETESTEDFYLRCRRALETLGGEGEVLGQLHREQPSEVHLTTNKDQLE
jgi:hypothetical protein